MRVNPAAVRAAQALLHALLSVLAGAGALKVGLGHHRGDPR